MQKGQPASVLMDVDCASWSGGLPGSLGLCLILSTVHLFACFLGDPFKEERKEERRGLMFLDGSSV